MYLVINQVRQLQHIYISDCDLPVGGAPLEYLAKSNDKNKVQLVEMMKKYLRNIRRNEQDGLLWPSDRDDHGNEKFPLKLLSSGGSRQIDIEGALKNLDVQITVSVLADFLKMGHENVGSFSLMDSKADIFVIALAGHLDMFCDEFNTATKRLLRLNGMDPRATPRLTHGDTGKMDMQKFFTSLQALANSGFPLFPNEELQEKISQMLGVKPPSVEEIREHQETAEKPPLGGLGGAKEPKADEGEGAGGKQSPPEGAEKPLDGGGAEKEAVVKEFNEADHPRDDRGRFGEGIGESHEDKIDRLTAEREKAKHEYVKAVRVSDKLHQEMTEASFGDKQFSPFKMTEMRNAERAVSGALQRFGDAHHDLRAAKIAAGKNPGPEELHLPVQHSAVTKVLPSHMSGIEGQPQYLDEKPTVAVSNTTSYRQPGNWQCGIEAVDEICTRRGVREREDRLEKELGGDKAKLNGIEAKDAIAFLEKRFPGKVVVKRDAELSDVSDLLAKDTEAMVLGQFWKSKPNVNLATATKEGHWTVIDAENEKGFFTRDSGLPPGEHGFIAKDDFYKQWHAPGDNRLLIAVVGAPIEYRDGGVVQMN